MHSTRKLLNQILKTLLSAMFIQYCYWCKWALLYWPLCKTKRRVKCSF